MNRLSLAAVGWVDAEAPIGNRLRWSWPETAPAPDRIIVERAPISIDDDPDAGAKYGPAIFVPPDLWKQHGDNFLAGSMPVEIDLASLAGGPVQAVRFEFASILPVPALVQAFDGDRSVRAAFVEDGDLVVIHAASMDRLTIMTPSCTLEELWTLDVYASTDELKFETIAELNLAATGSADLSDVEARYAATTTLDADEWKALRELWDAARSNPLATSDPKGGPNAWQSLQLTLATRWEHAVLCGLGFVDGPGHKPPAINTDSWQNLLAMASAFAYRVRDPAGLLANSNIVCVPGATAPDLAQLSPPAIENAAVRLAASGSIRASWDVAWAGPSTEIVGAEIEETVASGSGTFAETYDGRGRRETDPPGSGFAHREEFVESHVVDVTARARAQDGFDRVGTWSVPTTVTLPIDHYPQPPPLRSATHDGTTAILTQAPPGDWAPDALVEAAGGALRILRRVADPLRHTATVVQAIPMNGACLLTLSGAAPSSPSVLVGGQVTVGKLKGTLRELTWPVATVDVGTGDGAIPAVAAGAVAALSQSPTHQSLFVQVHQRPATGPPSSISFADPLPAPTTAEIIEYRGQLAFASQVGPLGGAVQAFRLPKTPAVPPPFTVKTLGVDFYARTLVQLELTNPSSAPLEVWWADGNVALADFSRRAVPGDAGLRYAEGGTVLYDTLSVPIPNKVDRIVTIGVQAANAADGRGDFVTVVHTLKK